MSAPLPECLVYLLKEAVLKRAKRDTLSETMREMMADQEVKSVLKAHERPLRRSFTDKWRADKDGSKQSRDVQMAMSTFIEHLSELRLLRDATIHPTPSVTCDVLAPRHSNLSQLDAKGTFSTGQNKKEASGNDGRGL